MSEISRTKKITTIAMLCALAYIAVFIGRIPVILFLKYDPKDVIITVGGFIWGPMVSLISSVIVSFIEMFTISDNGLWGLLMNIISTCAFACTAAFIYKKKHTAFGALIGLIAGCLCMSGVMLIWNYLITPLYMDVPREVVAGMLLGTFLPFNLIKSGLNAGITFFLYKPVVTALRKAGLVEKKTSSNKGTRPTVGYYILFAMMIITCVLLILSYNKVI